jgi:hypothetical protein
MNVLRCGGKVLSNLDYFISLQSTVSYNGQMDDARMTTWIIIEMCSVTWYQRP